MSAPAAPAAPAAPKSHVEKLAEFAAAAVASDRATRAANARYLAELNVKRVALSAKLATVVAAIARVEAECDVPAADLVSMLAAFLDRPAVSSSGGGSGASASAAAAADPAATDSDTATPYPPTAAASAAATRGSDTWSSGTEDGGDGDDETEDDDAGGRHVTAGPRASASASASAPAKRRHVGRGPYSPEVADPDHSLKTYRVMPPNFFPDVPDPASPTTRVQGLVFPTAAVREFVLADRRWYTRFGDRWWTNPHSEAELEAMDIGWKLPSKRGSVPHCVFCTAVLFGHTNYCVIYRAQQHDGVIHRAQQHDGAVGCGGKAHLWCAYAYHCLTAPRGTLPVRTAGGGAVVSPSPVLALAFPG